MLPDTWPPRDSAPRNLRGDQPATAVTMTWSRKYDGHANEEIIFVCYTLHTVCVLVFTVSHKQQKCSCINLLAMQLCFTPTESVDCHCIINGLRGEGEEGHRSPAW